MTVGGVRDQITSLFKIEDYIKPKPVKTVYESGNKPNK